MMKEICAGCVKKTRASNRCSLQQDEEMTKNVLII